MMDRIIVVSNHSKDVLASSVYDAVIKQTGEKKELKLETPVMVVPYPVRHFEPDENFELELEYDFNYLLMAQWSDRKNIENTNMNLSKRYVTNLSYGQQENIQHIPILKLLL